MLDQLRLPKARWLGQFLLTGAPENGVKDPFAQPRGRPEGPSVA